MSEKILSKPKKKTFFFRFLFKYNNYKGNIYEIVPCSKRKSYVKMTKAVKILSIFMSLKEGLA